MIRVSCLSLSEMRARDDPPRGRAAASAIGVLQLRLSVYVLGFFFFLERRFAVNPTLCPHGFVHVFFLAKTAKEQIQFMVQVGGSIRHNSESHIFFHFIKMCVVRGRDCKCT